MEDLTFCKEMLKDVSRTFAIPIGMLRERLEIAVTCGYLLCRIVDTVEDEATLSLDEKDALYADFLEVIERGIPASEFSARFSDSVALQNQDSDHVLCRDLGRVMNVMQTLPSAYQEVIVSWVGEMVRGMSIYSHRPVGPDGLIALASLSDLERYCYFVAGTVGHMLTELFILELPDLETPELMALKRHSESFGLGLQLVNILKDITDDRARGWSFVPRLLSEASNLPVSDLLEPVNRRTAHQVVEPIFQLAEAALENAFSYCLAIPKEQPDIRLFCLLPLWMAVRTLVHARGNDAQFIADQPVKIDRAEVTRLVQDCMLRCGDDEALRESFAALSSPEPTGQVINA
jgi:farnesyl-diphosphate farnesyltransferase